MFGLGDLGGESARVSQEAAGRLKAVTALEFSLGLDFRVSEGERKRGGLRLMG